MIIMCAECGKEAEKPDKEIRRQLKKNSEKVFFCSLSCAAIKHNKDFPSLGNIKNFKGKIGKELDQYSPFRYFLSKSKIRNKENNLDLEYLKNLWDEQNGICPFTGKELKLYKGSFQWQEDSYNPWKASLDRIDSSKGYIKGNVRYVCLIVNLAKHCWNDSVLIEMCISATEYNKSKLIN